MAFTKQGTFTDDFTILADKPNKTAAEMKAMFQSQPGELKTTLNNALDLLMAVTDGASGADNIGTTAIAGLTGGTAQALLEALKGAVDAKFTAVDASDTVKGIVELATDAEMTLGTSTVLAITPANAKVELDKKASATTVSEHLAEKASRTTLGHVAVDNETIYADDSGMLSLTYSNAKIYGVKIDTTNSNPTTALTYTNNAVGFIPASGNNGNFNYGSWVDKFPFNQIKPCLYKEGAVNYYLNPNNYAQKADGVTASDITSGADGDVMVEFPKIWWKFETIGTDLYIRYTNAKIDEGYKCLAHMRGATEKDKCYISAYLGYNLSSELRSLSGKMPTVSQIIGAFRTLAQANGAGYDQMAYFQILMLQVLFIVMFKSRNSQTALGRGYVDGNSAAIATGGANVKGMFYGETTGKLQNKFCGIEDFWGNLFYWVDGFYSDASRNMLIGTQNFDDTGSGYTNYGQGATADLSGHISTVQGGTETGFVVKATAGSATMYFADSGYLYASRLPSFGGAWTTADYAGAFSLRAYDDASYSSAAIGARLLAL